MVRKKPTQTAADRYADSIVPAADTGSPRDPRIGSVEGERARKSIAATYPKIKAAKAKIAARRKS